MVRDVIYNKCAIIERCLARIREEYAGNPENLQNYTKQDSIILNIQRACEACIDLAKNLKILEKVIEDSLTDLQQFSQTILRIL